MHDRFTGAEQRITYESIETLTDHLDTSLLASWGAAIRRFFEWIGLWSKPGAGAEQELALIGGTLPRALNGTPAEAPAGESDNTEPEAAEGGEGESGSDNILQRLFES